MSHWSRRTSHLYDRIDHWIAKYGPDTNERLKPWRDGASGEERFTELVRDYVTPTDTVVDIGAGDGRWLMTNVAPRVYRAIGLDYAARRLWHGQQRRAALDATNTQLLLADGRSIPISSGAVDAVFSRRGPWSAGDDFMREGLHILGKGGLVLEIAIGEQNGRELEDSFSARNQMHDALVGVGSRLDGVTALYRQHGLNVLVAESYLCKESFASREALSFRLETTPVIDGFDLENDAPLVDAFIAASGLSLTVHRLCLVAGKAA